MVMPRSKAPHAFLNPLDLVCDFPEPRVASWLRLPDAGAGETSCAKLATPSKYMCPHG